MLEKAVKADYEAVCSLYREACEGMEQDGLDLWHWGEYPSAEIVEEDIRRGEMYVVRGEKGLLGCVCVNRTGDPEYAAVPWQFEGEAGLFHRIAVSRAAQGQGLAGRMLTEVEDILRGMGCTVLRGDVSAANHKALKLYARMGMTRPGSFNPEWGNGMFYALEMKL